MNKNMGTQTPNRIYPAFTIPESFYQIILVNNHMSMEVMDEILDHIYECHQFSVDTESEMSNNKLSIIQIHTIPPQLPSMVLLVELFHLPHQD